MVFEKRQARPLTLFHHMPSRRYRTWLLTASCGGSLFRGIFNSRGGSPLCTAQLLTIDEPFPAGTT